MNNTQPNIKDIGQARAKRDEKLSVELGGDVQNARQFADKFEGKTIYVPSSGAWHSFDGVIWKKDEAGRIVQDAITVAESILLESAKLTIDAAKARTDHERKAIMQEVAALQTRAKTLSNRAKLEAMLSLAKTDIRIAADGSKLDDDNMILAVKNGVVDLATGQFRDGRPADYCTKQVNAEYAGGSDDVDCPTWKKFLKEVQPDPDVRAWLQRFVGYCLTGNINEQIFCIFHGYGQNGKSVFTETIKHILGSYATTAQFDTFIARQNGEGVRNDLACLDKVRLVVASEGQDGARLDESIIKQITGDEVIKARFLHKEFFEYLPKFKFILVANHKPVIQGTDLGIWRRPVLVPWTVTIPKEKRDKGLRDKLKLEQSGILAWCLEGLSKYLEFGLEDLPSIMVVAKDEYKKDSDVLGVWIEDCCILHPDATSTSNQLMESYKGWCEANGHRPLAQKGLANRLQERGITLARPQGQRGFAGIRLNFSS